MKKFKKIAAIVLAMVMALAMAVPAFAATATSPTSTITVNGLAANETTTVKIYQVVGYDSTAQAWVKSAEWVGTAVDLTKDPIEIDWDALKSAAPTDADYTLTAGVGVTTVSQEVPIGAYLIVANGTAATYTVMGTETYNDDATYLEAVNASVDAKTAGYGLDKSANDNFVAKGQEVTFTITTTFPTFQEFAEAGGTYVITDEVQYGLDLKSIDKVTVGGTEIVLGTAAGEGVDAVTNIADDKQSATVTWSGIKDNNDAGKTVIVTITATVTTEDGVVKTEGGYKNSANAKKDGDSMGSDDEVGYTGDITLTKVADDAVADDPATEDVDETKAATVLTGAEFSVYTENPAVNENAVALYFVKISDGVYDLADANTTGATQTVVATKGTVQVKGLAEGTYYFKETKAPYGYSINATPVSVEISDVNSSNESVTANVSMTGEMVDTKLSSLPSTGGIGTTIFTVAGCMIMIAAGGMLIVSRRRKNA